MRQPIEVPHVTTHAVNGMVCSVDHLATSAGVDMLRAGGSAADAAIATSAALAVTTQHLCGMGGDLWARSITPTARPQTPSTRRDFPDQAQTPTGREPRA